MTTNHDTIEIGRGAIPFGGKPGVWTGLADGWAAFLARAKRKADEKRTLRALRYLDDHLLRDVGLTRYDVARLENW